MELPVSGGKTLDDLLYLAWLRREHKYMGELVERLRSITRDRPALAKTRNLAVQLEGELAVLMQREEGR